MCPLRWAHLSSFENQLSKLEADFRIIDGWWNHSCTMDISNGLYVSSPLNRYIVHTLKGLEIPEVMRGSGIIVSSDTSYSGLNWLGAVVPDCSNVPTHIE